MRCLPREEGEDGDDGDVGDPALEKLRGGLVKLDLDLSKKVTGTME